MENQSGYLPDRPLVPMKVCWKFCQPLCQSNINIIDRGCQDCLFGFDIAILKDFRYHPMENFAQFHLLYEVIHECHTVLESCWQSMLAFHYVGTQQVFPTVRVRYPYRVMDVRVAWIQGAWSTEIQTQKIVRCKSRPVCPPADLSFHSRLVRRLRTIPIIGVEVEANQRIRSSF
jgi:hypothetical protein